MTVKVSDLIVEATTKCKKGFACLSGKVESMCRVESSSKDCTLVIKPQFTTPCEYRNIRDGKHYCVCPVRNDIYKRYKI
jgi:hypothetical protein